MSTRVKCENELREAIDCAISEGWTQLAIVLVSEEWKFAALSKNSIPDNRIIVRDDFAVCDWRTLSSLISLTSLDLSSNRIGVEGARALSSLTKLTFLNLQSNQIGVEGARALSSLTKLTFLDLQSNRIGVAAARVLSSLTKLTFLDLGFNQIGYAGACALSSLAALTSLDLTNNIIGDEGVRALSSLTELTCLNLSSNAIGNEGAGALSSLTTLTSLGLGFNEIGAEGARALSSLTALTSLELMCSPIGDEGARALSSLTALTSLNLYQCALTRFPLELLNLSDLKYLNVRENPIVDLAPELWSDEMNCLPAVRAHFADLQQGAEADRELKLILLGNGRVGKTSIVRFLMDEPFDNNESSTHGIQLRPRNESLDGHDVRVNLWDFGGQDIYFNTHALFLKSRAVFMIVWDAETERQSHHIEGEMKFENRPLQYWLDYVRAVSPDSAVIVVQNKCDEGIGIEPDANLGSAERTSFSALNNHFNGEVLISMLRGAIRRTLQHPSAYSIGRGRWRVKQQIRKWQDEDDKRVPKEPRQHQLLSHRDFVTLCEEEPGAVSSPDLLLRFLHDTGAVFHDSNLFNNQIILDQRWAIEAIYTIFHRKKCYRQLRERGGRFRLHDLADLAWDEQEFSAAEQRLFLGFMQSCFICFKVGRDDGNPIYLAPQLLPALDELPTTILRRRQERLESVDRTSASYYRFRHRFLHEGIMLQFLARIGKMFGDSAIYWRDGVQIDWPIQSEKSVKTDRAVAEIVCHHKLDNNPSRGEILLTAWGEGRDALLAVLRNEFERLHGADQAIDEAASLDGMTWVTPTEADRSDFIARLLASSDGSTDKAAFDFLLRRDTGPLLDGFAQHRRPVMKAPDIYLSYLRNDGDLNAPKEQFDLVDRLYESLRADGHVVRRRDDIPYKGDLNVYVEELGRAACIVAIVSKHSLRSANCMFELLEVHKNMQFRNRLFPIVFPDAKLRKLETRIKFVAYWKKKNERIEKLVEDVGIAGLHSNGTFLAYERIRTVAQNIDSVLAAFDGMATSNPVELEANNFEILKQAIIQWLQKCRGESYSRH